MAYLTTCLKCGEHHSHPSTCPSCGFSMPQVQTVAEDDLKSRFNLVLGADEQRNRQERKERGKVMPFSRAQRDAERIANSIINGGN